MKNIILGILLTFTGYHTQAQWSHLYNSPDTEVSLHVKNADTIFLTTEQGGKIWMSFDSGNTWSSHQTEFTTSWLLDMHFPTPRVGYACGGTAFGLHRNIIAKTSDYGLTWDSITSNDYYGYSFTSLFFLSEDTGFVIMEDTGIHITYNGGDTFIHKSLNRNDRGTDIHFTDKRTGFISTYEYVSSSERIFSILRTTNRGDDWAVVYADTIPGFTFSNSRHINKLFFVDKQYGYASGENGTFLTTIDSGKTWSRSIVHPKSNITAMHFTSKDTGYINNAGGIYKTVDGGKNWDVQKMTPVGDPIDIAFANHNTGFALTYSGVYRTTNSGGSIGLLNFDYKPITVYPNPTQNNLNFDLDPRKIEHIALRNVQGKVVLTEAFKNSLNIGHLPKGIYILEIRTEGKILTSKLVLE